MNFERLQLNVIQHLRDRVHNGELTERSLARITGISEPHLHNALKGKRLLSIQKLDRILAYLELDLIDLIQELKRRKAPNRRERGGIYTGESSFQPSAFSRQLTPEGES